MCLSVCMYVCMYVIKGGDFVRMWVIESGSYNSLADMLTWLDCIAFFQFSFSFSKSQTEGFEQTKRHFWSCCICVLSRSFMGVIGFIDTEILFTIRWQPIACYSKYFNAYWVCVLVKFPDGRNYGKMLVFAARNSLQHRAQSALDYSLPLRH
jgi:hypothetical protein